LGIGDWVQFPIPYPQSPLKRISLSNALEHVKYILIKFSLISKILKFETYKEILDKSKISRIYKYYKFIVYLIRNIIYTKQITNLLIITFINFNNSYFCKFIILVNKLIDIYIFI